MRITREEWNEKKDPIFWIKLERVVFESHADKIDEWVDSNTSGWWYRPDGDRTYSFGREEERNSMAMLIKMGDFDNFMDRNNDE